MDLQEIFKIYNIPENVSIVVSYDYTDILLIENNIITCTWNISLGGNPNYSTNSIISMIKSRSNGEKPVKKHMVYKKYYTLINKIQALHNENGYAYEKYYNHELIVGKYYINGDEIKKDLVEQYPEILKDKSLRKIIL